MEIDLICTKTLDCMVTYNSGYNKHKVKTATIRELIVDDAVLYRIVKNHVLDCQKCNPIEVLEVYLNRRKNLGRFHGFTSAGLVELMHQYVRGVAKRNRRSIPEKLIKEFIWRSGHAITLISYEKKLSNMEIWNAIHLIRCSMDRNSQLDYLKNSERFRIIDALMDSKKPVNEQELDNLMMVAEVSQS